MKFCIAFNYQRSFISIVLQTFKSFIKTISLLNCFDGEFYPAANRRATNFITIRIRVLKVACKTLY